MLQGTQPRHRWNEESEELPGETQTGEEGKVSGDVEEMGATCPLKALYTAPQS